MATVYSYLRFSRLEQRKGDSKRRQLEKPILWAEQNGHVLDTILKMDDEGLSGYTGRNRTEGCLAKFLDAMEAGRVEAGSILAVENFDRLTRECLDNAYQLVRQILLGGVDIKTFSPDEYLTKDSLNDPFKVFGVIMILSRANEESEMKSERIGKAWQKKRNNIKTKKLTAVCPSWLKLVGNEFETIEEHVETVKKIFQLSIDGLGATKIVKILHDQNILSFKQEFWNPTSIKRILHDRSVLGEFQPYVGVKGQKKRIPAGEAVKNYFPQIISENTFYKAQNAIANRANQRGKHGKAVTNLFTGLLLDARDKSNLTVEDSGFGKKLASSAATKKVPGALYLSFPYKQFEKSIFHWGKDLHLEDVLPKKKSNIKQQIEAAEGEKLDCEHKVKSLKERIKNASSKQAETLTDLLLELVEQQQAAEDKVTKLKREQATPETEALVQMKSLIAKIEKAEDKELYLLRLKLRSYIKQLVKNIYVLTVLVNNKRVAIVDILLNNNQRKKIVITPEPNLADDFMKLDIRKEVPTETSFQVVTRLDNQMIAMEQKGLSRKAIAEQLGVSLSQVSRQFLKLGRRKKVNAKPPDWAMTWQESKQAWIKRHKGQRYFVGLTKLSEAHPELFKDRTAAGSYMAANAWWAMHKPPE